MKLTVYQRLFLLVATILRAMSRGFLSANWPSLSVVQSAEPAELWMTGLEVSLSNAFFGLELVDSRNAHRMRFSDDT